VGQLGKGATSYVYKVKSRKTGIFYAMKVLDKIELEKNKISITKIKEIKIHSQIKCD